MRRAWGISLGDGRGGRKALPLNNRRSSNCLKGLAGLRYLLYIHIYKHIYLYVCIYIYFPPPCLYQERTQGPSFPTAGTGRQWCAGGEDAVKGPALPGISSWETGAGAEESGGGTTRGWPPPRLTCYVKSPLAEQGPWGAGRTEGRALNAAAPASFCSPYGYIVWAPPSLHTASPLPTVLPSNVGFPFY